MKEFVPDRGKATSFQRVLMGLRGRLDNHWKNAEAIFIILENTEFLQRPEILLGNEG